MRMNIDNDEIRMKVLPYNHLASGFKSKACFMCLILLQLFL
jgi:hypothetical protein